MAFLCHCERSEAIQTHELDYFVAALLAMTAGAAAHMLRMVPLPVPGRIG